MSWKYVWIDGKMTVTVCSKCSGSNEQCETKSMDVLVAVPDYDIKSTAGIDKSRIKAKTGDRDRDWNPVQITFQNQTKTFSELVYAPDECFYIQSGKLEIYYKDGTTTLKFWNGSIESNTVVALDYNSNSTLHDANKLRDIIKHTVENSIHLAYTALMIAVQERDYQNVLFDSGNIWVPNQLKYNREVRANRNLSDAQKKARLLTCGTMYGVTSRYFYLNGYTIPIDKINFAQAMLYGTTNYPYGIQVGPQNRLLNKLTLNDIRSARNDIIINRFTGVGLNVRDAGAFSFISFFLWYYTYYSGHAGRMPSDAPRLYEKPSYEAIGLYAKAVIGSGSQGQQAQFESIWHVGWSMSTIVASVIAHKYIFMDNEDARKKATYNSIVQAMTQIHTYVQDSTIKAADDDKTKKLKKMVCTICRSVEAKAGIHPFKPVDTAYKNLLHDFGTARAKHQSMAANNAGKLANYNPESSNIFVQLTAVAWYKLTHPFLLQNEPASIPALKEIFEALLKKADEYETAAYNKLKAEYNL